MSITEIGIDAKGNLFVRPEKHEGLNLYMVYRANMGVEFDEQLHAFISKGDKDLGYFDWYWQILSAAEAEMGWSLKLTDHTKWTNIPPDLAKQIKEAKGPTKNLAEYCYPVNPDLDFKAPKEIQYARDYMKRADYAAAILYFKKNERRLSPEEKEMLKLAEAKLAEQDLKRPK